LNANSDGAWTRLAPHLGDAEAAVVRPVVNCLLREVCFLKAQNLGYDWLKQFIQLQAVGVLQQAGLNPSAIGQFTTAFWAVYDEMAARADDIVTLLLDMMPILIEAALRGMVTRRYDAPGWVIAYTVVPVLCEIAKSPCVQAVFEHSIAEPLKVAVFRLKPWLPEFLAALRKFFDDVGVGVLFVWYRGVVFASLARRLPCTAIMTVTTQPCPSESDGAASGDAVSSACASSASILGLQTLGTVAVHLGVLAAPPASAFAILGTASATGVVAGFVAAIGYGQVRKLLRDESDWRAKLTVGSCVEVCLRRKGLGAWIMGEVCIAYENTVTVKYSRDGEEYLARFRRDAPELRLAGADGALISAAESKADTQPHSQSLRTRKEPVRRRESRPKLALKSGARASNVRRYVSDELTASGASSSASTCPGSSTISLLSSLAATASAAELFPMTPRIDDADVHDKDQRGRGHKRVQSSGSTTSFLSSFTATTTSGPEVFPMTPRTADDHVDDKVYNCEWAVVAQTDPDTGRWSRWRKWRPSLETLSSLGCAPDEIFICREM
jgi:hypothetical protein